MKLFASTVIYFSLGTAVHANVFKVSVDEFSFDYENRSTVEWHLSKNVLKSMGVALSDLHYTLTASFGDQEKREFLYSVFRDTRIGSFEGSADVRIRTEKILIENCSWEICPPKSTTCKVCNGSYPGIKEEVEIEFRGGIFKSQAEGQL